MDINEESYKENYCIKTLIIWMNGFALFYNYIILMVWI